ncbi:MAG: hypothetical protein N3B21_19280 [Clostridia bacterium]|nr:hypothetical protein [Clostridia bacterium]
MSDSAGRIDLDLGINYQGFNKELNGIAGTAQHMVGGAFKGLGKLIAGAFIVDKVIDFGQGCVELASNLNEVQNVVDVTFGSMAGQVNDFAKSALSSLGMSELSAKKFTSTMGAMLKSSGITGQAMLKMSEGITSLSGDMASFYNLSQEDAFQKLRSGISGETEPLKQLGINMSVANMEAYALSKGIKTSWNAMSQSQQTLLRYNYLLSVTKDAQGDFARTSGSWANQTRLLSEQWKIFQSTLGAGFINILTPIIQGLNVLIQKLQIAAQYFKAFTDMIFGAKAATSNAVKTNYEMVDAAGGVGKSVKKAGKDVKGSLSSFDQLNVISQATADAMDGISAGAADMATTDMGGTATAPDIKLDASQFQPVLDILNQIKDTASQAGQFLINAFGPTFKSVLDEVLPQLSSWKTTLMGTFTDIGALGAPLKNWFINDLVPFWQQQIGTMGHVLAGILDSARLVFTGVKDAAMPILQWFVDSGLPLVTDFGSGCLTVFKNIFDNSKTIFDTLWSGAVNPGLQVLSTMVLDTLNIIKGFWDTWGGGIITGLTTTFDNITMLFQSWWESFLQPIVNTMLNTMSWLWDKHLKGVVQALTDFIGTLVVDVLQIYNKFIVPIVNFLIKTFGPTFANVFQTITEVVGTIIGFLADIAKSIIKILTGIINFITGIFTGDWEKAWTGVKQIFGGIFDGIVGILKGAINLIIDGINSMIRGLNLLQIDVPDWVPVIGGKKFGFTIPQVPKLAQGGMATGPTLAMVGDNRNAVSDPEVISPLSKLQEMMGASNQGLVEVLLAILDAIQNLDLNVDIDGEKLSRVVHNNINKIGGENNRVGKRMVTVGGVFV